MEPDIPLKTSAEVARMRVPGRLLAGILSELASRITEGANLRDIDAWCSRRLSQSGAEASQRRMGFPGSACVSVNNIAAHGVPENRRLEAGDLVTVDISTRVEGWGADAAWTYLVGVGSADARRLLRAAWRATNAGIAACRAGRRLGDVAAVIEHTATRHGCSVVREFTGHGIGRSLHETPAVANAGSPGIGTPVVPGMTLTIEPVLSLGSGEVRKLADGWTYVSADGALTAQFEQTVAVFSDHTEVLTFGGALDTETPPF
jgi:methionyl aminopeptidase